MSTRIGVLTEAFLYATARSAPALRRAGLVGDAVALWSRATRRSRAWRPHEEACRAFVDAVIDEVPARRTAVVLGSGLLRDVPIARMAREFQRVILVDAVHLLPARRAARRLGCDLEVADLTGLSDRPDAATPLAAYARDPSVDLVISANVLSQLAIAPERENDPRRRTASEIVAAHLADLADVRARVCLMTDVRFTDIDREGTGVAPVTLVDPALLPDRPDAEWAWEVAPRGEISRRFRRVHHVQAWGNLGAARPAQ